jgi:hypothetical protein
MTRALLLALVLTACATTSGEPTVVMSDRYYLHEPEPIEAPPAAAEQWEAMAECSDRDHPPLERITWYRVGWITDRETGRYPHAVAVPLLHEVYLTPDADRAGVIGHEILHLLLPGRGHWDPQFDGCDPIRYWRTSETAGFFLPYHLILLVSAPMGDGVARLGEVGAT